jgi:hypothetical protein
LVSFDPSWWRGGSLLCVVQAQRELSQPDVEDEAVV